MVVRKIIEGDKKIILFEITFRTKQFHINFFILIIRKF